MVVDPVENRIEGGKGCTSGTEHCMYVGQGDEREGTGRDGRYCGHNQVCLSERERLSDEF